MNDPILQDWLASGDATIPGRFIARILTSGPTNVDAHPPSSVLAFGGCYRLLHSVQPKLHGRLDEIAALYPTWRPFVREWAWLDSLYAACADADGQYDPAAAPGLARLLQQALERLADEGRQGRR